MSRTARHDIDALRIDRSERGPSGRGRAIAILAAVVGIAAAALAGWWWLAVGRSPEVRVATVRALEDRSGMGSAVLNASGYVTARRRATVSSEITGKVVEVLVEEGMTIAAGQVVARLDDEAFRAAMRLAESERAAAGRGVEETRSRLALAELTLARVERLVREEVSGQEQLDQARTEVEALRARVAFEEEQVGVAERQVELRRTELAKTVIRAPFDGVVISKDAQPGEMVSPISAGGGFTRTGLCTIVDMGSLEIEVEVNESYISRVSPGQPVQARLDAYSDWLIPSRVITTIPAADRQKATVLVRIGFDALDPRILPDMGVKVSFLDSAQSSEGRRERLFVPRAALRGEDTVFVVAGDRVERRAIGVGVAEGEEIEVLAGLRAGERVVVDPPQDLEDGARVRVRDAEQEG